MQPIIAIQGIKGSFHHQVALDYYSSEIKILECLTFNALAGSLASGEADQAVMAIENSIVGSIIPNYALLDEYNLQIVGEFHLKIEHNLMGLTGQSITDLKEVHSHPMALLQCKKFFSNYPNIRLVEAEDTADIARKIEEDQIKGIGAIASLKASELFNLDVFAESIQTIKNNVTRFVIVQAKGNLVPEQKINKAALKFVLDHKRGSLAAILNVLSDCKLNLTKIQSLPVIETPGKYSFFVDVTFESFDDYVKARTIIEIMATEFKILGEYPKNTI